jgi:hypothetical protein
VSEVGTRVTRVASNTDYGCWVITVRRLGEGMWTGGPAVRDVPADVRAALAAWLTEAGESRG